MLLATKNVIGRPYHFKNKENTENVDQLTFIKGFLRD